MNYYHQVTVTIDETLVVVLRSSHRVEGCVESVTPHANVGFQACMHAVTIDINTDTLVSDRTCCSWLHSNHFFDDFHCVDHNQQK